MTARTISAWKLASGGCRKYIAAWAFDLAGTLFGLVWPIHVIKAFAAGRTIRNANAFDVDELWTWTLRSSGRSLPDLTAKIAHRSLGR